MKYMKDIRIEVRDRFTWGEIQKMKEKEFNYRRLLDDYNDLKMSKTRWEKNKFNKEY